MIGALARLRRTSADNLEDTQGRPVVRSHQPPVRIMALEILLALGSIGLMYKIADEDGSPGLLWAGVTLILCGVSLLLPYPIFRIVLALILSLLGMFVHNCIKST